MRPKANPYQAIALLGLVHIQAQLWRDGAAGMRGDADAATFAVVAETVVLADNLVAFDVAKAHGNTTVIADVAGGSDGFVGEAVEDYALVEQARSVGLVGNLAGEGPGYQNWARALQSDSVKVQSRGNVASFDGPWVSRSEVRTKELGVAMHHYERTCELESMSLQLREFYEVHGRRVHAVAEASGRWSVVENVA